MFKPRQGHIQHPLLGRSKQAATSYQLGTILDPDPRQPTPGGSYSILLLLCLLFSSLSQSPTTR